MTRQLNGGVLLGLESIHDVSITSMSSGSKVKSHVKFAKEGRKTFIVGLDGSDLSFQAIRTAVFQMAQLKDNILIVTIKKSAKCSEVWVEGASIINYFGNMTKLHAHLVPMPIS